VGTAVERHTLAVPGPGSQGLRRPTPSENPVYGPKTMSLVLYTYWRSSCSYRLRIALNHKELSYESVFVNLVQGGQSDASYVAKNPTGYLPTLVVDGEPFVESVAILELLEERFPDKPLMPKEPVHRARVRALVQVIASGIQPLQNLNVLKRVSLDAEAQRAWAKHYNERGMTSVEGLLTSFEALGVQGPFAYGDALSLADVCLVPQVYSAKRFGVNMDAYPRTQRAYETALALPAVQRAVPEVQPDAPAA
jgi:maleylpyruvate isomerase